MQHSELYQEKDTRIRGAHCDNVSISTYQRDSQEKDKSRIPNNVPSVEAGSHTFASDSTRAFQENNRHDAHGGAVTQCKAESHKKKKIQEYGRIRVQGDRVLDSIHKKTLRTGCGVRHFGTQEENYKRSINVNIVKT